LKTIQQLFSFSLMFFCALWFSVPFSVAADNTQNHISGHMLGALPPKPVPFDDYCIEVLGQASTEGVSKEFARQMAIRDALKQASMQTNLSVSTRQEMVDYKVTRDNTRFTSQSKVRNFKILDSGFKKRTFAQQFDEDGKELPVEDASTYQVLLEVCLTEDPQACNNIPGNQLQPKLAVAQVVTTDVYGARDISNLLVGYQHELHRRLPLYNYKNIVKLENGLSLQPFADATPNLDPETLNPVRDRTGAQYLMLTVIRNLSMHNEDYGIVKDIRRFYNYENNPTNRYIEVDYYLVDLVNHQVVEQQRIGYDVEGDVRVGRDRAFGTSAFFKTDTGFVFNQLLNQQVKKATDYLACKPVETQIIDVREGQYILYLSAASGAQVGDEMAVYHKFGRNIRFQGVDLGLDSEPAGFLKIVRIQNKFAVAKVLAKEGEMQVGDIVKSW